MHLVTQGLVLRETDYKETDKILTVLTPDEGKMTVNARGCRKKNSPLAAAAQLLVYSDMTLFDYQERYSMNEANSLNQFWGVRSDLEKLALGSYFAEVAEAVAEEGVVTPGLLPLVLNSLYALDKLSKPPALIKACFEMKLMCLVGYEPLADACAVCGAENPPDPRLNLSAGVLHCAACREELGEEGISMPLDTGSLNALRHVVYGDAKRLFSIPIEGESLTRFGDVCEAFLLTQLERGFRTLDFYKQLKLPT